MPSFKNQKYFQIALYVFLTAAAIILFTVLCLHLEKAGAFIGKIMAVFSPFIYGFIIAYLVNPIMKKFEKHVLRFPDSFRWGYKLRRPLSVTMGMIVFLLILAIVVGLVIPQVVTSFKDLQAKITDYVAAAQKLADDFIRDFPLFNGQYENLSEFLDVNEISTDLQSVIAKFSNFLGSAADYVISYGTKFVVEVKNILIGFIAAVYMLLAKERLISKLKKFLAAFLSRRHYVNLIYLIRFTDKTVGGFIYGKIIDSIIIGILTFIIMSITKMPFPLLIAVIVGITNVIPFFGPFIGAVPSTFLILIEDPIKALWFILFVLVLQQLDGNIIGPAILGDRTGLSSFWVLFTIILFGGLWGIVGMIVAVPLFAVIYDTIKKLVRRGLFNKEQLELWDQYKADYPDEDPKKK